LKRTVCLCVITGTIRATDKKGEKEGQPEPVGGLNVLEVVGVLLVIKLDLSVVNNKRIADKQMGNMSGKELIDSALAEVIIDLLVLHEINVVVFGAKRLITRNVCGN
jgi:hypothetical protein